MIFSSYDSFVSAAETAGHYLDSIEHRTENTVGGRAIAYYQDGAGEVVLILPMLRALNFLFAPLIQLLARKFRVLTYSPQVLTNKRLSPEARAGELVDFVTALNLSRIHLISWSDTCATACHLLERNPHLIRSTVFINVPNRYRFPVHVAVALRAFQYLPLEYLPIRGLVFKLLGQFMGGPILRPEWVTRYAYQLPQLVRLFKYGCLPSITSHRPPTSNILTPALVLAGNHDIVVPVAAARAFAEALGPQAQFCLLPDLEHIPTFAQSGILAEPIVRFLER